MPGHDARAEVDYRILGALQVRAAGRAVTLQPRGQALLGLLLTEPSRAVSVDRLVEALWDGEPPARSRQQLHTTVARLRRALRDAGIDDVLRTDGSGYRLAVEDGQVDAGRFRRLVTQASGATAAGRPAEAVRLLDQALGLWRGPALAGMSTSVLAAIGANLDEQRLAAVERWADLRLSLGEGHRGDDDIVGVLRSWVTDHPLRERLREHLMIALYRSGRRAEALAEFDDTRRLLADELGIDPGPGLAAVHQRVLNDDPDLLGPTNTSAEASQAAGPNTPEALDAVGTSATEPPPDPVEPGVRSLLPAPTADFTGRDAELSIMLATIPDPAEGPAVVTIDGMAGVGKTALAVQAAHALGEDYPGAHLFLDLHGHTPGRHPLEPAEALDRLLRGVGVPPERIPGELEERAALWRTEAGGRRVLIVLDNAADSAQVKPLLPGTPGSLAVITSRRRLTGLESALPLSVEVLRPEAAAALFVMVAGARTSGTAESADVAEVVELCGFLPLAVRLAAARLRHRPAWTVSALRDRLLDGRHRLGRLTADDRSVSAAFAVSYENLPSDQQRMFRLLGLHPGRDIDAWAAAALADVAVDRAESLLEDLLDHNLLLQTDPDRYTFHDLLRQHAQDVADHDETDAERGSAVHRLLDYYVTGAAGAAALIAPELSLPAITRAYVPAGPPVRDHSEALAWFTAEDANLPAITALAAERGHHTHAAALTVLASDYVNYWCRQSLWLETAGLAVSAAQLLSDRTLEARVILQLGRIQQSLGNLDSALRSYEAALAVSVDDGYTTGQAVALSSIGDIHVAQGRYDLAVDHLRRSVELRRAEGDQHGEAIALIDLGNAIGMTGADDAQLDLLARAGRIADEAGYHDVSLGVLINSGAALVRLKQYDDAETRLRAALAMIRAHGNRLALAAVLSGLGRVCQETGRHTAAADYLSESLEVARANGVPEDVAQVLTRLADVERQAGRTEAALDHARTALEISRTGGYRREEARSLAARAATLRDLGDVSAARRDWELALAIFDEIGAGDADRVRSELDSLSADRRR